MAEVLTPGPGQSIVDTNGGHHRGHDDWIKATLREVAADFRVQSKATTDGFTAAALAAAHVVEEDREDFGDVKTRQAEIEGRGLLEAAKNAAAGILEAAKNTASLGVQAADIGNRASVERTNFFNLVQVEAVKNAAAAQLEAQKNASAIAAQVAACCCELKEKIGADGDATRALINANTITELQARLVATQRMIPVTIRVGV